MVEKDLKRTGITWQCANKECGYKAPAPVVAQAGHCTGLDAACVKKVVQ